MKNSSKEPKYNIDTRTKKQTKGGKKKKKDEKE